MNLRVDSDVRSVLEYMQTTIPTNKLIGVAEAVLGAAPLLWGKYPQEPVDAMTLETQPINIACAKQPAAIESGPVQDCAGDDSAAAVYDQPR